MSFNCSKIPQIFSVLSTIILKGLNPMIGLYYVILAIISATTYVFAEIFKEKKKKVATAISYIILFIIALLFA